MVKCQFQNRVPQWVRFACTTMPPSPTHTLAFRVFKCTFSVPQEAEAWIHIITPILERKKLRPEEVKGLETQ